MRKLQCKNKGLAMACIPKCNNDKFIVYKTRNGVTMVECTQCHIRYDLESLRK